MIIAALLLCHGKGNTNLLCPTTSIFMATSDLRTVKDHVSSLANAIPTGMTEKYCLSIQNDSESIQCHNKCVESQSDLIMKVDTYCSN